MNEPVIAIIFGTELGLLLIVYRYLQHVFHGTPLVQPSDKSKALSMIMAVIITSFIAPTLFGIIPLPKHTDIAKVVDTTIIFLASFVFPQLLMAYVLPRQSP